MQAWLIVESERLGVPLLVRRLCAGFPSPADDYIEENVDLARYLVSNRAATFLFRVSGDCMIDAGIHDGDMLVVDRSMTARHGDVVVAIVESDHMVKRLVMERGRPPRLVNQNRRMAPYVLPEGVGFEVWGVATFSLHSLVRPIR